jgi:hypothetical protein
MSPPDTDPPPALVPDNSLRREDQRQLHLRLVDAHIQYHLACAQLANSLGEVALMREHLKAAEKGLQEFRTL